MAAAASPLTRQCTRTLETIALRSITFDGTVYLSDKVAPVLAGICSHPGPGLCRTSSKNELDSMGEYVKLSGGASNWDKSNSAREMHAKSWVENFVAGVQHFRGCEPTETSSSLA